MNDVAQLVLAIIGAVIVWTTSIVGGVIWLMSWFRRLEKTIYRESAKHSAVLYHYDTRIRRLETKAFGFSGGNGGPVVPDDGETFPGGKNDY